MTVYIIMGIAGTGKTTIGKGVAGSLDLPFLDADDFHPQLNIAKMKSGVPLAEDDRVSWTQAITNHIVTTSERADLVLACSALSKPTRARLRAGLSGNCVFIHLHAENHVLKRRLSERKGHMFSVNLLASQFTALQMPKRAHKIDVDRSIESIVNDVCALISPNK